MSEANACPACHRPVAEGAFQCPACELLLDTTLVNDVAPPSAPAVIEALLAPPQATLGPPERAFVSLMAVPVPAAPGFDDAPATRRMTHVAEARDVPKVVGTLELMSANLSTFEAFVISRMDGSANVEVVRQSVGLSDPEMQAVLATLHEKKVVRLDRAGPRPFPMPAPTPVPMRAVPVTPPPVEPAAPAPRAVSAVIAAPTLTGAADHAFPPSGGHVAPAMTPLSMRAVPPPAPPPTTPAPAAVPVEKKAAPAPARYGARQRGAEDFLQEAIALEQAGDVDRAIELLEEAVSRARAPAALYNRLGIVLLKERRDYQRAEQYLHKAATLEPDNAVYQQNHLRVLQFSAVATGKHPAPAGEQGGLKKLLGLFSGRK